MKKFISVIFAVLLLLFIAVPIANGGPPPPGWNGYLRVEERLDDHPIGEVDASPGNGLGGGSLVEAGSQDVYKVELVYLSFGVIIISIHIENISLEEEIEKSNLTNNCGGSSSR